MPQAVSVKSLPGADVLKEDEVYEDELVLDEGIAPPTLSNVLAMSIHDFVRVSESIDVTLGMEEFTI